MALATAPITYASPHALDSQGRPPADDFALEDFAFGPYVAADLPNGSYALMVLPFDCDIEDISFQAAVAAGAGDITFKVAASGTAIGSGTAISGALTLTSANGFTAATAKKIDLVTGGANAHKNLAAGTVLGFTTANTITTMAGACISVTLRRRPYRVNDASAKIYP